MSTDADMLGDESLTDIIGGLAERARTGIASHVPLQAVRDVVSAAHRLLDETVNPQDIADEGDRRNWHALNDAYEALAALVPRDEVCSGGALVEYLWPATNARAVTSDEYGPIEMMRAWPAERDDDSPPDPTALSRALAQHDALPDEHRPPDTTPLRNCLPGIWPTVGDLRAALDGGAGGGSEPWETLDTCPSKGESVWIVGGHYEEPVRRRADGEWWRMQRRDGHAAPTHWCHDRAPAPPRSGQRGGDDA